MSSGNIPPSAMGSAVPYVPSTAPFTPAQRAWLNGYLAGLFADANVGEATSGAPAQQPARAEPLLVMFGSQTGTAEGLAKRLAKEAAKRHFEARVFPLNDYVKAALTTATKLIVISSTWGDGDPPDNAAAFWAWLISDGAPRLENLQFAVLGLGDRNYSDFCGASKKLDARLEALGATRIVPRGECDVDYEATAKEWIDGMWQAMGKLPAVSGSLSVVSSQSSVGTGVAAESSAAENGPRNNPFPARLLTNRRLNAPGSEKDTRHFEISLSGSGLAYEVGDVLGVMPTNCPVLVEELLAALGFKGEETVKDPQERDVPLHAALLRHYAITQAPRSLVQAAAERARHSELLGMLAPERKSDLDQWLFGRDVVDVLLACRGARFTPDEFIACLRRLQPRLYSISSSPKAHPDQVHLTVAVVRYQAFGRGKKGVCSTFLAERAVEEVQVPVFVQPSSHFRLPEQGETPIIMIGPGTGIAPFRAFLEERRAVGATGRNWLFFGDQRSASDFLYREELDAMLTEKALTRLDTAFSRDQAKKIYVQDRMLENAHEVWDWLEGGAHVYVCGDAKRMAKDVDAALHAVIEKAGGKTLEQAAEYVANMKQAKRYQRDVY